MSKLDLDHVTIAGNRLENLEARFAEIGLYAEYGGVHSNRITHMALLGFDDGSYIEFISTVEPGLESPWWHQYIVQDAGPCAWAVQVGDIRRETERIASLGIAVRGPAYHQRERPDGKLIEWDLAFPGEHEPGWKLPFLISDRTPRALRERLDMLGESPCAYLIGSWDLNTSIEKRNLIKAERWFQKDVAWFDLAKLGETRLGVTAV